MAFTVVVIALLVLASGAYPQISGKVARLSDPAP